MASSESTADLCIYLPSFEGGGAERVFVRLANHLAHRGMDVHVIVNSDRGPVKRLVSPDVSVHVLGRNSSVRAVPRLVGLLRTLRPPLLISALTRANLAALIAARLSGGRIKLVVCERNQFSAMRSKEKALKRRLITLAARMLYPSAHAVIGNTDEVTNDIARIAGLEKARTGVIHNPAPESDQIEAARQEAPPHPWFEQPFPVAIAMGRLVPQKDYPTMLQAIARSRPDLRLMILGDGPQRDELAALAADLGIADRVEFLGYQINRFAYLVRADLFVLSSRTEGFPNALIEAVSAGIPSISTDCDGGGAREILGNVFDERIVPVADADGLATAIDQVLQSWDGGDKEAERLKNAGIADRYRIDAVADAFLRLGST